MTRYMDDIGSNNQRTASPSAWSSRFLPRHLLLVPHRRTRILEDTQGEPTTPLPSKESTGVSTREPIN